MRQVEMDTDPMNAQYRESYEDKVQLKKNQW